jgi:hypothetical protein
MQYCWKYLRSNSLSLEVLVVDSKLIVEPGCLWLHKLCWNEALGLKLVHDPGYHR